MTREEAIDVLRYLDDQCIWQEDCIQVGGCNHCKEAINMAIEALTYQNLSKPNNTCEVDLINRADAIDAFENKISIEGEDNAFKFGLYVQGVIDKIKALPSADAVHGWRIGKPTERGEYIVTVDSMRHGMVELMYYGKPLMPNCKVRGKCWYRSDDEWGDIVYDDEEILAWLPLPKPYREENKE